MNASSDRDRLGRDQQPPVVDPVGEDAGEEAEDEERDEPEEDEQSDRERRLRLVVDEPRQRDILHPGSGQRDELPDEEEAVVPVLGEAGGDPAVPLAGGSAHS